MSKNQKILKIVKQKYNKVRKQFKFIFYFLNHNKDIAHVAVQGTSEPHDMLPGTDGDSDNQKVPPSRSSTFIFFKKKKLNKSVSKPVK